MDDLSHALIAPMFVVAKLLVSLGLRSDLTPYLGEARQARTNDVRRVSAPAHS
jgi:uncharacterized membrane protein YGL010W